MACALLLSGCATTPNYIFGYRLAMRGEQPFCIYDRSWRLGTWEHPLGGTVRGAFCTEDKPRPQTGLYHERAWQGIQMPWGENLPPLVLTFRREQDGPELRFVFPLAGKLTPEKGWKPSTLNPQITPTGVVFMLRESGHGKYPESLHRSRERVLGYMADSEAK